MQQRARMKLQKCSILQHRRKRLLTDITGLFPESWSIIWINRISKNLEKEISKTAYQSSLASKINYEKGNQRIGNALVTTNLFTNSGYSPVIKPIFPSDS